jgi:hypothetical protein
MKVLCSIALLFSQGDLSAYMLQGKNSEALMTQRNNLLKADIKVKV